jgi:hypothetical protein
MPLSLERWLLVASLVLLVLLIPRAIEKPARVDTFARQVECRKAAEALIEHLRDDVELHLHPSWQAHFSPKYGHCYAQVFNMDIRAAELFDALENQALATWVRDSGDEHVGSYAACELPGESSTGTAPPHYPARCAHAQAYIAAHMEN